MLWLALSVVSIIFGSFLALVRMPGALLFGPMIAAMLLGLVKPNKLQLPKMLHSFAQAMIGCLVARAFNLEIIASFQTQYPIYLFAVGSTVVASLIIGLTMSRLKLVSGTTSIWGLLPGAASAMLVMAEEFGADARLVAFMQYLRVVCVGFAASLIAGIFGEYSPMNSVATTSGVTAQVAPADMFGVSNWTALGLTVLIACLGTVVGPRVRLPAATLLIPMLIGGTVNATNICKIELPQWLLAFSYGLLGWTIGFRFTKDAYVNAWKILPQTLGAIALLIALSAGTAFVLHRALGVDPLSAYLATSPGGMDTIAIIAATTKVNMPFVMSLQTARFFMVLLLGPPASRFVATKFAAGISDDLPSVATSDEQVEIVDQIHEDESELD